MSGYLNFYPTGNEKIDAIVSLLNEAGNAYHHTDGWHEEIDYYGGKSYCDLLQEALNNAAKVKARSPKRDLY